MRPKLAATCSAVALSDRPAIRLVAALAAVATLSCGGRDDAANPRDRVEAVRAALTGQCVRDVPALRAMDRPSCSTDVDCPCGSYCDLVDNVCRFACMVPPGSPAEACASGSQCDNHGRCTAPAPTLGSVGPVLAADPPVAKLVPGTPAQIGATLSVFSSSTTVLLAAAATEVRVVAGDGIEASCDGVAYSHECRLTTWSFAWNGTKNFAAKPFQVRAAAGNTDGHGQVTLAIDAAQTQVAVPITAGAASQQDGVYVGTAVQQGSSDGVPIEVRVRGNFFVIRDPSLTLAPDGFLVLELTGGTGGTPRNLTWLTSPGNAAASVGGNYSSLYPPTFDASKGTLRSRYQIAVSIAPTVSYSNVYDLLLQRTSDLTPECTADSGCPAGSVCPAALQSCVPSSVWTPPATTSENQLEDVRSTAWWNALAPSLASSETSPNGTAFATSGADLIETLMCTNDSTDAGAGRLGIQQLSFAGISRSGDLGCVNAAGQPNLVPGPVGLVTYADRNGSPVGSDLLATCLQDLERPPTDSFSLSFGTYVGQCANLARFLPALRALSTDELGKHTTIDDNRSLGLYLRLLQSWTQLHGFIASTGLSQRGYDDAVAASPPEALQKLTELLDVLDAGWTAILDKRIAPTVLQALKTATTASAANSPIDYRTLKKPVVYWTFNGTQAPLRDIVRNVDLVARRPTSGTACGPVARASGFATGPNMLGQFAYCPGYVATLPGDAPSIGGNKDLSVVLDVGQAGFVVGFQPYFGGTLFQTQTLGVVLNPLDSPYLVRLALVHPTDDGGTEWLDFSAGVVSGLEEGAFLAIVRDTKAMTYTIYSISGAEVVATTQRYYHKVGGILPGNADRKIQIMTGDVPADNGTHIGLFPAPRALDGSVDDFAIFDSLLSKREFVRFVRSRGSASDRRDVWPQDMNLTDYPTQDVLAPLGPSLLDAQAAYLDLVARYVQALEPLAQTACDGRDAGALATLDSSIARAGRSVRQSILVEGLVAATDPGASQLPGTKQLHAKRIPIGQALYNLRRCRNPFAMSANEVPLYFGDVSGETGSFFAASDHLLSLAEGRAGVAAAALADVRVAWDQARQSQIQQVTDTNTRKIRTDELEARFGGDLSRLCGIADLTDHQIAQQVKDGTFSVDTCFIQPTATCQTQASTATLLSADPTCYRGAIGAALMDIRTATTAQQAAFQTWQAALGNAQGAERLCVLKEMDLYGCTALDKHKLTGVTCPAGHQGTIQLIADYNHYVDEKEAERGWFSSLISVITTVASVTIQAATAPGAGFLTAAAGSLGLLTSQMNDTIDSAKRHHEAVLQERALAQEIATCWTNADQFQRAIGAAEQASKEAGDRIQAATIAYQNAIAAARGILLQAPNDLDREATRPSIPIAFNYWLPEKLDAYRSALESARRYTYIALRATEYDTQQSFVTAQTGRPSRSAVLGAWRPSALQEQLQLMRDATNARRVGNGRPKQSHLVLSVEQDLFGRDQNGVLGDDLVANAQPVYSTTGEYLGLGVPFTFLPASDTAVPVWRCAERLVLANAAASGFAVVGTVHVKLIKRNIFASRSCTDDGFQIATLRPEANLLVASGDDVYAVPATNSVADIDLLSVDAPDVGDQFKNADTFTDGASSELAGQGLFGSYLLLFTAPSLASGLDLSMLSDLLLRFDFVSIDNTPPIGAAAAAKVQLDRTSGGPIFVP